MNENINEAPYLPVLDSVFSAISTERGRFYPDKNYGSAIKAVGGGAVLLSVLSLARQAVAGIAGAYIESVQEQGDKYIFTVKINNFEGRVSISK